MSAGMQQIATLRGGIAGGLDGELSENPFQSCETRLCKCAPGATMTVRPCGVT